jgi:hypothetical protein
MEEISLSGHSSGHSSGRKPSRRASQSPSYFKNVVSLGPDIPLPLSSTTTTTTTATKTDGETIINFLNNNNNNTLDNNGDQLSSQSISGTNSDTTHDGINNINSTGETSTSTSISIYKIPHDQQGVTPITTNVRSRHRHRSTRKHHRRGKRRKERLPEQQQHKNNGIEFLPSRYCSYCNSCLGKMRSTLSCMNVVARVLSWCTVVASLAGVIWYSYELKKTG